MHSPLDAFAGLLDRSLHEIAALAADARTFDGSRIGQIADIWDNNTFPLVSAACAVRPLRARRARAGLQWMAGLGAARRAFTELAQRWRHTPPDVEPAAIPSGPAMLRYASYHEPHEDYDVARDGFAALIAAVPEMDPAAPWRLAGEQIDSPPRFRITATAFDGVHDHHRDAGTLTTRP